MKPSAHSEPAPAMNAPAAIAPRACGALLALPCWIALAVAGMLTPDRAGYGTHEQLGLPSCSFLVKTGYPCPSCGLTTSMAAMAHGQLRTAWKAQPFGVALFVATVAGALAGTWQLASGRPLPRALQPRLWWALAALLGMLAGWAVVVLTGLAAGKLPLK